MSAFEKRLFEKYPKIFRQKDLPMTETCLCWGCECGPGWEKILDELCEKIQKYVDEGNIRQIEAVQVKEKFGGLRFYIDGGDDYVFKLINEAENKSYETCEECGATEGVTQTSGWVVTLCPKCLEAYNKKRYGKD